ncbi:MAG: glycosyltransferase [Anditalea sp.]
MKIVRIVPFLNFGGVEKRLEISSKAFSKKAGIDLTIITLGHGGVVAESLEKSNIKVILLNQSVKIPNLVLVLKLIAQFKNIIPDVVHCSGAEANFHGLLAAKLAGVPVKIGEEIGFPQHHLIWRFIFKMTYLCADLVIGISHAVADNLVKMGEVPPSKIRVIYNPVEINRVTDNHQLFSKSVMFTFITVCRLVPIKNIESLIMAFSQVLRQVGSEKARLIIVGDGPSKKILSRLCEELNISEQVFFSGYRSSVIPYLKQADAFVLPSFSEGFSIALVEAMVSELPCIVTKVGGPSEIIQEGKTGFLIDPHRIDQLVQMMLKIFQMSDKQRSLIGARAKKEVEERFSVDRYIKGLLKVYDTT